MTEHRKKILIAGAGTSGWWNVGDEAIFRAMISDLRRYTPDLEITLVSDNPAGAFDQYDITEIPFREIDRLVEAARDCDLMILGGGGLFYDYWGANTEEILTQDHVGLGIYAGFALLSTLLGKPLVLYAVGAGPLFTKEGKSVTSTIFKRAVYITVRDVESKNLIASFGIDANSIHVTADPVFSMDPIDPRQGLKIINENFQGNSANRPLVCIVLRNWANQMKDSREFESQIAHALDQLAESHNASFVFVPFHRPTEHGQEDDAVSNQVITKMKNSHRAICVDAKLSLDEKVSVLQNCDLVLGMRLHSLIFAIRSGIPAVAIAYDDKVNNLMQFMHHSEYCLDVDNITTELLYDRLKSAYVNRQNLGLDFQHQAVLFKDASLEQAKNLTSFLNKGSNNSPSKPAYPDEYSQATFIKHILNNYKKVVMIYSLNEQIHSLNQQAYSLNQQIYSLNEQVQTQHTRIFELTVLANQLDAIFNSRSWKFILLLRKFREKLIPIGSFREKVFLGSIRLIRKPSAILLLFTRIGQIIHRRLPVKLQVQLQKSRLKQPQKQEAVTSDLAMVLQENTDALNAPRQQNTQQVNFVVPTFFDFDGNNMFFGGAERYLIELVHLVKQMGYEVNVYQCGKSDWVRYYRDVRVIGMDTGGNHEVLNKNFHQLIPPGTLTVYFAFYLAAPLYHERPTIGISHGIYWDDTSLQGSLSGFEKVTKNILDAISHASTLVSVDTNTINWVRATNATLAEHCIYIPNFVDLNQFNPTNALDEDDPSKEIVVLYPRRLYEPRGFWLVYGLVADFLQKYPRIIFHFVGKADPREEEAVKGLVKQFPGRVKWYFLPPERMNEAYASADIALIPTVRSEGTSLSCLEALASGNSVIATNVGGLPNLVLPGYNGLLIEPTEDSLRQALSLLMENPDLRRNFSKRGMEVANSFNIENWRLQWEKVFKNYLPKKKITQMDPITAVFYPPTGETWQGTSGQRLHSLAEELAEVGVEVFWVDPKGRGSSGNQRIHLIGKGDDLYLSRPWVIISEPKAISWVVKHENPVVIYDILDEKAFNDAGTIIDRVDFFISSSKELASRINSPVKTINWIPNGVGLNRLIFHEPRTNIEYN